MLLDPAVEFLRRAGTATAPRSNSVSAPAGSPCRCTPGAHPCTASTCPGRWSRGYGPSPAATTSASPSATSRTATVGRTFRLAYLVFNTITNLTTQDEQVTCFRNVAAHLEPGGCSSSSRWRYPTCGRMPARRDGPAVERDAARLGFDEYDTPARSLLEPLHGWWTGGSETSSTPYRYVWPAELDLMGRLAGMTLRERWSGWTSRAVHRRQPPARVGLAEAGNATVLTGTPDSAPRRPRCGHAEWVGAGEAGGEGGVGGDGGVVGVAAAGDAAVGAVGVVTRSGSRWVLRPSRSRTRARRGVGRRGIR